MSCSHISLFPNLVLTSILLLISQTSANSLGRLARAVPTVECEADDGSTYKVGDTWIEDRKKFKCTENGESQIVACVLDEYNEMELGQGMFKKSGCLSGKACIESIGYTCSAEGELESAPCDGFGQMDCSDFGPGGATGYPLSVQEDGGRPDYPKIVEGSSSGNFGIRFFEHDTKVSYFACDELTKLDRSASNNLEIVPDSCKDPLANEHFLIQTKV